MRCKECGNEIPYNVKFCGVCGTLSPQFQAAGDEPVREQRAYEQRPAEPADEYGLYKQPEDVRSYRAYEQETAPKEAERPAEKVKVKRTCSLSVVVFCGVVIFLLSVACGVFAGLYYNARTAAVSPYSAAWYESGGES